MSTTVDEWESPDWLPPGARMRPTGWTPPARKYTGPDLTALVINPDGVTLRPGAVEDDPQKQAIFETFKQELESL